MTFTKEMTEELSEMFSRYYEDFWELRFNDPQFYPPVRQMWGHFLDSLGVSEIPTVRACHAHEVLGLEDMVFLDLENISRTIAVPNEVAQKALVLGYLPVPEKASA